MKREFEQFRRKWDATYPGQSLGWAASYLAGATAYMGSTVGHLLADVLPVQLLALFIAAFYVWTVVYSVRQVG